jgi:hypothetical protein
MASEFPQHVGEVVSGVWYYPSAAAWGVVVAIEPTAPQLDSMRPGGITWIDGPLGANGRAWLEAAGGENTDARIREAGV